MELHVQSWYQSCMTKTGGQRVQKGSKGGTETSIVFKYYIHDTADGYSLEMYGPLSEASVSELACCWQTARTTLRNRHLTLDLRGVTSVDDPAKQWLASMALERARFLPESFLRDSLAGSQGGVGLTVRQAKRGFIARLFNSVRGADQTSTVNADSVRVTGR